MSVGKAFGEGGKSRPTTQLINPMGVSVFDRLRKVDDAKVKALLESMREVGLISPIVVRPNTVTKTGFSLIVGAHRLAAAKKLGWQSIAAIVVEASDQEARLAEIDENLERNELSQAERAMHMAERKRLYEAMHPETKHGGDRKGSSRKLCDLKDDRFTADTARKTGASERKVQLDVARGEKIEGIAQVVGTSLDKGEELDALVKLPKERQKEIIARAAAGEKVSAKTESKKLARATKEKALAEKTITSSLANDSQLYNVIYADPPWAFATYSENGMDRSAENHYPTMAIDDILGLKVPAAGDSVLFLWATVPMLQEALDVLRAWGFAYKSQIVWVKDRIGTGYWARNQHEILLIGTRGSIPAPAMGTQPSSVIEAPLGRHSAKPEAFAEMIEKLFPTLPKVELFCRSPRDGWAVHGNQAAADEV